MLTHIQAYLESRQQGATSHGSYGTSVGSSRSRRSSQLSASSMHSVHGSLPPEVQLWVLQWKDITIEHLIGKGSFGWVSST